MINYINLALYILGMLVIVVLVFAFLRGLRVILNGAFSVHSKDEYTRDLLKLHFEDIKYRLEDIKNELSDLKEHIKIRNR